MGSRRIDPVRGVFEIILFGVGRHGGSEPWLAAAVQIEERSLIDSRASPVRDGRRIPVGRRSASPAAPTDAAGKKKSQPRVQHKLPAATTLLLIKYRLFLNSFFSSSVGPLTLTGSRSELKDLSSRCDLESPMTHHRCHPEHHHAANGAYLWHARPDLCVQAVVLNFSRGSTVNCRLWNARLAMSVLPLGHEDIGLPRVRCCSDSSRRQRSRHRGRTWGSRRNHRRR